MIRIVILKKKIAVREAGEVGEAAAAVVVVVGHAVWVCPAQEWQAGRCSNQT